MFYLLHSNFMSNNIDEFDIINLMCPMKYSIQGSSKAGKQTGFWVHGLKCILDAGIAIRKQPNAVFITHSHTDHSQMLPNIITSREKLTPVIMTTSCYLPMQMLQMAIKSLSDGKVVDIGEKIWEIQKCDVMKVKVGDVFTIDKMNNVSIEILKCYHTCESIGFGFNTTATKLKPEYAKLSKEEIMKNKQENINMMYQCIVPQFVFFGDTNIDALTKHDEWKKYSSIIIECTGFPDNVNDIDNIDDIIDICNNIDKYKTSKYYDIGHIHLYDVLPILKSFPEKQFVLIHTSDSISFDKLNSYELLLQLNINENVIICKK